MFIYFPQFKLSTTHRERYMNPKFPPLGYYTSKVYHLPNLKVNLENNLGIK